MPEDLMFDEEVFFSYASDDLDHVRKVARRLWEEYRIASFVADDALKALARGSDKWEKTLIEKVTRCRFFALYNSRATAQSQWVNREVKRFHDGAYSQDNRRRMFVLSRNPPEQFNAPAEVRDFLYQKTEDELVVAIAAELIKFLTAEKTTTRQELETLSSKLDVEQETAQRKVREAFRHYAHTRFWKPFSQHGPLHIFTCGRDVLPETHRGSGGRTNIDQWDYQTVLQITHYFAANFPRTEVKIEDPVAKLAASDLMGSQIGYRVANLMRQLENKDCVVIGSPDVSDFAEIILAKLHGTQAFAHEADKRGGKSWEKQRGFTLIKGEMKAPSSTYRLKKDDESVGVEWVEAGKNFKVIEKDGSGSTYGILVVCFNPFSHEPKKHKIIIFSGFTGVATFGMSKLLTSMELLEEFFKIDQKIGSLDTDVEALIGVQYAYDLEGNNAGDRRRLLGDAPVTVEAMVEIPRLA
jgi:hypothetical protein